MLNLPISLTTLISIIVGVLAIFLYLREYFLRKKDLQQQQKVSVETKQKSFQLLNAAQMAETEVIGKGDYATQKMISEFKLQLQDLIEKSGKSITSSQEQLIIYMADLQKRATEFEDASKSVTEKRINGLFEKLETQLSDFLIQTEQKTTSSIDLELKATRQLIDTYKNQQLALIDKNIIAMMEQTLNLVLGKKLSLQDQLDLIYEALEKAKIDKFVI